MYIRLVINYVAPLVFPIYSKTSIECLQIIQNRALRLVLGCHALLSQDHLHDKAKVLPAQPGMPPLDRPPVMKGELSERHP